MKATADATEADKIAEELGQESAAHFTVAELMWLMGFVNKMRWGTTAEQEKKTLDAILALRDRVDAKRRAAQSCPLPR